MSDPRDEGIGTKVRGAFTPFRLTDAQKRRHREQLGVDSEPHNDRPQLLEAAAIAMVAVLVVGVALTWQALSGSDLSNPNPDIGAAQDQPPIATVEQERQFASPHTVPSTCPVTTWVGPEQRIDTGDEDPEWQSSYYLDGSGIALNNRQGLLFEGENDVRWLSSSTRLPRDIRYSISLLTDSETHGTFVSLGEPSIVTASGQRDRTLVVQPATLDFPVPGCWRLRAEAEESGLGFDAIVYVFPHDS